MGKVAIVPYVLLVYANLFLHLAKQIGCQRLPRHLIYGYYCTLLVLKANIAFLKLWFESNENVCCNIVRRCSPFLAINFKTRDALTWIFRHWDLTASMSIKALLQLLSSTDILWSLDCSFRSHPGIYSRHDIPLLVGPSQSASLATLLLLVKVVAPTMLAFVDFRLSYCSLSSYFILNSAYVIVVLVSVSSCIASFYCIVVSFQEPNLRGSVE